MTEGQLAFLQIAVGVVVEKRKATSPWADVLWRPIAVLIGEPAADPWTPLASEDDVTRYYAGTATIELHRSEAANYRRNLEGEAPAIWIALQRTGGDPPFTVAIVTADPAEGEALTEPNDGLVDTVPMPPPLREAIVAFVAQCPAEPGFVKRTRDRANPEAFARRRPALKETR